MRRRLWLDSLDARDLPSTYYISPLGSDAAAGSLAAPWKTLQKAANAVAPGDHVVVRAGTYTGFNLTTPGTAAAPITFSADPGVTITAPNPSGPQAGKDGINVEGADYAIIEGFDVVGMPRAGIRVVTDTNVIVRNNVCDNNGTWGILTGFAQNVDIENNVTSNSHTQHGIYVGNSADNPVVRNNTSFGNYQCGIHMNGDLSQGGDGTISNALVEDNVIYDNGRGGGSSINLDGVSSSVVRNNLIYNAHSTGIALYDIDGAHGAQNNVVENNTVRVASDGRWALQITDASTGNRVFNNILLNDGSFRGSLSVDSTSRTGLGSDYNVAMDRFTLDGGNSVLTLAQWRSQTGQDAHSKVSSAASLFVGGTDYHLLTGSPAVDAGTGSLSGASAPAVDMAGTARPSGAGYDVGAFELSQAAANPPTATNDAYTVRHDHPLAVAAPGVLANDTSPAGHTLTAVRVSGPSHGALTLNANGSFTYTPAAGYVGSDSFTYTANDGGLPSQPATVTLSVTDQTPTAANDTYRTGKDQALTVAAAGVLANDSDADGDPLTAVLAGGPSHGALTLNANGSFTYTPNLGYVGADSFSYAANDGVRNSAPATVSLSVAAAAPQVKSVVVNDGSAQRSVVRSVTVTFDSLVTLDAGAFTLVRTGGGRPTLTTRVSQANGQTSVVLTFSGNRTAYGSLGDGNWTLTVVAAKVHSAADPTLVMAANSVTQFHRLYGDSDGDRDVDATDKSAFLAALGKTDAASLAAFDYNADGLINGTDQSQFNKRYGKRI